jgi:beta-phosphoglucomutase-like phosphatase (HAD superfamily)
MIRAVVFERDTIFSAEGTIRQSADSFIRACAERFPLLLMTSSSYAVAEKALKVAGLASLFLDILTVAEVEHPKPAPDLLLATLGRIGFWLRDRNPIEPQECLVVERSAEGVEAARRAQMRCLAITHIISTGQLEKADFACDSFIAIDLDEVLRALK